MISSAVVNRYANALADVILAPDSGVAPPQAIEQLRAFDTLVASSHDLRAVLASPAVPVARKRAIIKDIAARMDFPTVMRNFVLVVNDHRRSAALGQIAEAFETIIDERLGFVRAEVQSAFELDNNQEGELSSQLGKLAGAPVRIKFAVDPDLIGGVTARIGSTVYDGSVRGRLASMRTKLMTNR
jgi:F-type H+-transporting ATPase subunit delta